MYWHVGNKKCCVECFSHAWLREHINATSSETGVCDYCGTRDAKVIAIATLSGYFENMLGMYRPSETFDGGDPLIYLIQEDWELFPESFADSDEAVQLVDDIMLAGWDDDSGESPVDANELYQRVRGQSALRYTESLEDFLEEIKEFREAEPDFHELLKEDLFRGEARLEKGSVVHRSRLGWDGEDEHGSKRPWQGDRIGANPAGPAGRANRKGKVALYCAKEEGTALAEVRPVRGYIVSCGVFELTRDVRVLNLADPVEGPNPFLNESLVYELEIVRLLNSFASVLSEPLLTSRESGDDPPQYWSTQRLCEYIASAGFEGILYPSAMNPQGVNLVLFDPSACEFMKSKLVRVTEVEVKYDEHVW